MKPQTFAWKNEFSENIFAWYLRPSSDPKSIVLLVHGYGEHSLRYLHWAKSFVGEGHAFCSWDHAGHGQSEGQRGHIRSMEQFFNEITTALAWANNSFPGVPIVLYGHSMGGTIALNYAINSSAGIQLLIATSPWLQLAKPVSSILQGIVSIASTIAPRLTIKAPLDAKQISHVEEVTQMYATDPLNHTKITPRLLNEINQSGRFIMKNASGITTPTLLLHGSADGITSFQATSQIAEKIEKCSFVPWKNMYHELHNETVREEVFGLILQWLTGNLEQ
jgi:alpha-beta hydrolase superfamily lysophospholipase